MFLILKWFEKKRNTKYKYDVCHILSLRSGSQIMGYRIDMDLFSFLGEITVFCCTFAVREVSSSLHLV